MERQFETKPKSIDIIGSEVFLETNLYQSTNDVSVIYINPILYEIIFNKKYNYEEAKKDILNKFNVTINDNGTESIGCGYVDRQGDPTDIALNGNKGSGRAFYLYRNCNLKGDKTPLATSLRDDYNNGKYALDCAIQEGIISNVLYGNGYSNFQTLAILDKKDKYLFPHTDTELPCGAIIRVTFDKELYRFSHLFINNKLLTKDEILDIAKKIGVLEGRKFIDRFLHGAWSIGNISINADLIDLDTSFYVKGRHPEWSFTDKYITNYFGYEYRGNLMVLDTILESDLNVDKVSKEEVEKLVIDYRIKTIKNLFPRLLGYDDTIYPKYRAYFDKLADIFIELSPVIFNNYDNLNCLDPLSDCTNLFDFSKLFRFYEIAFQNGTWNESSALNLLINKDAYEADYIYDDPDYQEKIVEFFEDRMIIFETDYIKFINKAIDFIQLLTDITLLIDKNEKVDKKDKLVRAYLENEDKTYLFAKKWIRAEFIDAIENQGEETTNTLINVIIDFYSKKDYLANVNKCDLRLFEEGMFYREISNNGFNRFCFKPFYRIDENYINVMINGIQYTLVKENDETYKSKYLENINICEIEDLKILSDYTLHEIGRDIKVRKLKER